MSIRHFVIFVVSVLGLLSMLSLQARADAFKCKLASGKIVYQSEQCGKNTVLQGVVKVKKMTPEEAEAAKAKLNAWKEQQAVEDAAKADAERARRADLQQQESLDLQRRSVAAQEQQAAQSQQNRGYGVGLAGPRYGYGYQGYYPNYPGYPNPQYNNSYYGGQYYQYPQPPQRRPGEYTGPPVHNTLPSPIKAPPSQDIPDYYSPMR